MSQRKNIKNLFSSKPHIGKERRQIMLMDVDGVKPYPVFAEGVPTSDVNKSFLVEVDVKEHTIQHMVSELQHNFSNYCERGFEQMLGATFHLKSSGEFTVHSLGMHHFRR